MDLRRLLLCLGMVFTPGAALAVDWIKVDGPAYVTGTVQRADDDLWGFEFAGERDFRRYFSYYASAAGANAGDTDDSFFGFNIGGRVGPKTALRPFVGLGTYFGFIVGDDEPLATEPRTRAALDGFGVYPEAGFRFPIVSQLGLLGTARYYINIKGSGRGFWMYTAGLSYRVD